MTTKTDAPAGVIVVTGITAGGQPAVQTFLKVDDLGCIRSR